MNISGMPAVVNLYAPAVGAGKGVGTAAASSDVNATKSGQQLTPDEQKQVQRLKERDRQVRQHEQAHMAAGAGLVTASASFTYQKGPDGVSYAVGGEVGISTARGRTPDETIQRAQQVQAAALAPADPSGQDRAVAAQAAQMEQQAQMEKSRSANEQPSSTSGEQVSAFYSDVAPTKSIGFSVYA